MRLRRQQHIWETLARDDPFWAVLTDEQKKGNRWNAEEFFARGREDVAADLGRVRRRIPALRNGTVLDFGCGVGRLSQALAGHFSSVTGIDISAHMLSLAARFNAHPDRVRYIHNTSDDLRVLPDGSFDFVYSMITLQHIRPGPALRYVREFVRVAAPEAAILFQIPDALPPAARRRRPFTLWPDTLVKRLYRDVRTWLALTPEMGMYAIPRARVEQALADAGAQLVHAERSPAAGSLVTSWTYLALKPR